MKLQQIIYWVTLGAISFLFLTGQINDFELFGFTGLVVMLLRIFDLIVDGTGELEQNMQSETDIKDSHVTL